MKQLTNKDYKKILKFYKKKVPKTRKKIKKAANKILAKKFCSCIQKVRKKTKSKKYSAIGICTKSVIQGKGFKRGNFNCKKKRSIKLHKGGKRRRKRKKRGGTRRNEYGRNVDDLREDSIYLVNIHSNATNKIARDILARYWGTESQYHYEGSDNEYLFLPLQFPVVGFDVDEVDEPFKAESWKLVRHTVLIGGKRRRRTRKKKGKGFFSWFSSNNKKYQKVPTDNNEISQKTLFEQYKKKLIEAAKKIDIPTQEFEKWTFQESPYTNNGKVNLKLMEEHVIEAEEALQCMSKNKKGGGKRKKVPKFKIGSRISGEFPIENDKGNPIGKKPFYGVITNKLKNNKAKIKWDSDGSTTVEKLNDLKSYEPRIDNNMFQANIVSNPTPGPFFGENKKLTPLELPSYEPLTPGQKRRKISKAKKKLESMLPPAFPTKEQAMKYLKSVGAIKKGGKRRTRKKRGRGKRKKDDDDDKKFPGKGYTLGSSSSGSSKKKTKKQKKITDYKRKHEHGDECGICMENLVGNLKTYCDRHQFHGDCYQQLIDRNIKKCPMCRGEPNKATKDLLRKKHPDDQYWDRLIPDENRSENINEDPDDPGQYYDCANCGNEELGTETHMPDGWISDRDGEMFCQDCQNNYWWCHSCNRLGPEKEEDFRTDVLQYDAIDDRGNAYASAFGMQTKWGVWNDTTEHFSLNYNSEPGQSLCPECNYKQKWEDCGRCIKYQLGLDVIDNKECLRRRKTRRHQVVIDGKTEQQVEIERQEKEIQEGKWKHYFWYEMTCPKCSPLVWEDDPENVDRQGNRGQMITNGKGQQPRNSDWHGGFNYRDGSWQKRVYGNPPRWQTPISGPDPNNQGGVVESKE